MTGALLALALAAAADPCLGTDAEGRTFPICFDPGNRLELTAGGALSRAAPARGGALDLGAALRRRRDTRGSNGALEWLGDQTLGEARALFSGGSPDPRTAEALLWRGTFVRHRQSPFVMVPGPRPIRLPFPFDVGMRFEVGGAAWDADRPRDVHLVPLRAALLLDLAGHGALRRLAFGPEVSWGIRLGRHAAPVHELAPFTAGVLDARAESQDGLGALALAARGGSLLTVPGGSEGFAEAALSAERAVVAVNDRPVALYAEARARGGPGGRDLAGMVGLRAALRR